jgi:hypothetical protein
MAWKTIPLLMLLLVPVIDRGEPPASQPERYFAIQVVDEQTGRGVPMVELQTTSSVRFYTDSAGLVAFDEPGLMNQKVFFGVAAHGYEFPPDGFGIRGVVLETKPGNAAQLKIKRINIAERIYRITGQGIYRDSVLLGRRPPVAQPLLNAGVTGQDGTLNAIYRGKLYRALSRKPTPFRGGMKACRLVLTSNTIGPTIPAWVEPTVVRKHVFS